MHGQKRSEYKSRLLNPEAASNLASKAQQWNALSQELLSQRRRLFGFSPSPLADAGTATDAPPPSPQILLTLTEKMLTVNPDPSHLWNIRREMLLYLIQIGSSTFDVQPELKLTAHCLQRNPKAYATWFHRKWSIAYLLSHVHISNEASFPTQQHQNEHMASAKLIVQTELDLCAQFLLMDERNFHCWNYRRFVVALLGSYGRIVNDYPVRSEKSESKSDTDNSYGVNSYTGTWSVWLDLLNDQEETSTGVLQKALMGAQISPSSIGVVSSLDEGGDLSNNISRIATMSKTELNELIFSEWEFTTSKIQDNFSNGSAFHYRSKLLPIVVDARMVASSGSGNVGIGDAASPAKEQSARLTMAREEWEDILLNAIFTEPDDQTPWWYHRFIVAWAKPSFDVKEDEYNALRANYESLLSDMADSLRELLEVEKENDMDENVENRDESKGIKCKWAYLGLHLVLSSLIKIQLEKQDDSSSEYASVLLEEAKECLDALMVIDPCRSERYKLLADEAI
ncbi:hypothetical protein HJC23_012771 [Cyclotella cryptica]|uniref:Geranylgeranyl transferase type-2 subunit alpha n=1 Tax=Cyclotella cryptica TaxID=29204 RepID=A0ABD3Q5G4_9STRA|eukprot:CCRYP_008983-RA/>CCRYP_008983-RA protein AED:0.07 eAED:0.07 QI:0/-1/0/1/-1/1/1/0/511